MRPSLLLSIIPNNMSYEKRIFLVRHGQTDLNLKKILQGGRVNIGINETGRKQSQAFYRKYGNLPFQRVYTSRLRRSYESVSEFIAKGTPHEALAELNEIDYGIYDGVALSEGEGSPYQAIVSQWDQGNTDIRPEGGESPKEVQVRMKSFIELLRFRQDENLILVSMHGRALRILLATMLQYDLKFMNLFPHVNLSLYSVIDTGSHFAIEKFNDTSHLKEYSDLQIF